MIGVKDIAENAPKVYSAAKILLETEQSDLPPELKGMMSEVTRISFERCNATVRREQVQLEAQINDLRIKQTKADLDRARQIRAVDQADQALIAETVKLLIRSSQAYVDIIMKYIFWAARAVDIYTQQPRPVTVAFDYGYIHPDTEEEADRRFERGDVSRAAQLARDYVASWSRLPDILYFRDAWESFRMSGESVHDILFVNVDDLTRLAEFRRGLPVAVTIGARDIPASRLHDKVEGIVVCLEGASSPDPGVTCLVQHAGDWVVRTGDTKAEPKHAFGRRRNTATLASTDGELFARDVFARANTSPAAFWGRGLQTAWRLSLEATRNGIDLSGLKRIRLALPYTAFLAPNGITGGPGGTSALPATTTTLTTSPNPSESGQPATLVATVSPASGGTGNPTGEVVFTTGAEQLGRAGLAKGRASIDAASLPPGDHEVIAEYLGEVAFAPSRASARHVVSRAPTTTTIRSDPNPSRLHQPVVFTVSVRSAPPSLGHPSGEVVLAEGGTELGRAALGGGETTIVVSSLTAGSHDIVAEYAGDATFGPSRGSVQHQVAAESLTALTSTPNPSNFGRPVMLSAIVFAKPSELDVPTGAVDFEIDAGQRLTTRLDGEGKAAQELDRLAVGAHGISATYSGDALVAGSMQVGIHTVARAPTILVADPVVPSVPPASLTSPTLRATLTRADGGEPIPGQTVRFLSGKRLVCRAQTDREGVAVCRDIKSGVSAILKRGYRTVFEGTAEFAPSAADGAAAPIPVPLDI